MDSHADCGIHAHGRHTLYACIMLQYVKGCTCAHKKLIVRCIQVATPWQCLWATARICGTGFGRHMARRPACRRMKTLWTPTLSTACRLLQIPLGRTACTLSVSLYNHIEEILKEPNFLRKDVLAALLSGLMHCQGLP